VKRLLFLFLLFVVTVGGFAQSWDLAFGGPEDEILVNGIEDANGDFVLCGIIGNSVTKDYDTWLVKVSSSGDTLLSKRLNDTAAFAMNEPVGIVEQDDGYLVFGYIRGDSANHEQVAVLKTDFNFNEQWTKEYGDTAYSWEYLRNVRVNKDSTIMGIGTAILDSTPLFYDVFIYKFSPQGDSLNSTYLQFPWVQFGYDIIEYGSGYKIITNGLGAGANEIANLDSNLNLVSVIPIDSVPKVNPIFTNFKRNSSLRWLNDSVYIAYSRTSDIIAEGGGQEGRGAAVIYFTENDSILSAHIFGKPDTSDKDVYFGLDLLYPSATYAGSISPFYDIAATIWQTEPNWYNLNKLDDAGNVVWEKYYGGDYFYLLWSVIATRDSGCLMVGMSYDWQTANGEERDIWIVKVGPDGEFVSTEPTIGLPKETYSIYPNPARDYFTIRSNFNLPAFIELYNITGSLVHKEPVTSSRQQVSVQGLSPGLYVYRLVSKGSEARGKLILN